MFTYYLELEKKLAALRTANGDVDSPEEDALLDAMEKVWYQLTEAERRWLDAPGDLRDGLMRARI